MRSFQQAVINYQYQRVPISSLGKSISALENRAMSIHREVTVPLKNHVRVDVLLLMDIYTYIYIY
jgi:hypothetical protein